MFHIHGHQDSCFFQYATLFIKGARMVDGEILETLWSTLNSISPSLCTATLAHWSEVLDDHMNDGNWKKMVSISEYLNKSNQTISLAACPLLAMTVIKKYKWAVENEKNSHVYFEKLSETPTPKQLTSWEVEILDAEARWTDQPSTMDVMATGIPKGKLTLSHHLNQADAILAPTLAGKQLELVNLQERGVSRETTWIMAGLKLKEQQWAHLPISIQQLPEMPTDWRWFNLSAEWEGGHLQMTFHHLESNGMILSSHLLNSTWSQESTLVLIHSMNAEV